MSKKTTFLSLIGLACLAAGIVCLVLGVASKVISYSLIAVGAFLFLGPLIGVRRVISLLLIAAVSVFAYYAVLYLLGTFGIAVQSQGKTAILLISVLFVYIFSSTITKKS